MKTIKNAIGSLLLLALLLACSSALAGTISRGTVSAYPYTDSVTVSAGSNVSTYRYEVIPDEDDTYTARAISATTACICWLDENDDYISSSDYSPAVTKSCKLTAGNTYYLEI